MGVGLVTHKAQESPREVFLSGFDVDQENLKGTAKGTWPGLSLGLGIKVWEFRAQLWKLTDLGSISGSTG